VGSISLVGMPMNGSWGALVFVLMLFLLTASAQGLFLSTLSDKQETAFSFAALLTMLPSVMLSGFIYPIRNMPALLQGITWLFPGRYLISSLRALMLRNGADLQTIWREVAALSFYTFVVMFFAVKRLGRILK